jgi:hypothetical protein
MAQQTAVEWLFEKIIISSEHTDNINSDRLFFYRLYQQAKQMDKEQHKETFKQSRQAKIFEKGMPPVWENFDQYYNETYGTTDRN